MPQKLADHIANSWRHLARGYRFVESLERFLFDGEKARAKLPSIPESLRAEAGLRGPFAVRVRKVAMPQKLADHIVNSWHHLVRGYQFVESLERFRFDGEKAKAKLPCNPGSLRAEAVRLFAMAIQVRETEYADRLIAEAAELQDQATVLEQAAEVPPNERGQHSGRAYVPRVPPENHQGAS